MLVLVFTSTYLLLLFFISFAASESKLHVGEKKIVELKNSDGSVVKVKIAKTKETSFTGNPIKWVKKHIKKKKVVDDAQVEEDSDYEVLPYEIYHGPLQTPQLSSGDLSVKNALCVNQIPFYRILLPTSPENTPSTSGTTEPLNESMPSDPNIPDTLTRNKSTYMTMRGIATNPRAIRRLSSSDPTGLFDPDDVHHSYLVVECEDPRKSSNTSIVSNVSTDSIYVISKLETGGDETSVEVSQSAVTMPAVEFESQLGSASASAAPLQNMSGDSLLPAAPHDDNVTRKDLHSKQTGDNESSDVISHRKSQVVESQYIHIKVEDVSEDTMHSIGYPTDEHRRSYLHDLLRGFRNLQHPTPPAGSTDASDSDGLPHPQAIHTDPEDSEDVNQSDDERVAYLMKLPHDIQNKQGSYCTFERNIDKATLNNESAYINIQCLKSDAEGGATVNENGSAPSNTLDM